eukprot:CAMPEP_0115160246 /NCGR_PEP_ID=MMETSP0227-20121206/70691_1 /TAXON_ID=89957 /ORGANISM="Polarella glacialis, Strain CCMP 1383" /LENGTH=55 /DNA_ID=CAMNT_0002572107 /DNA_START=72 /DNA_END=235 /DNA_ORIENTATION=-
MPSALHCQQQVGLTSPGKPKDGLCWPHMHFGFFTSAMSPFLHCEQQVALASPGKP